MNRGCRDFDSSQDEALRLSPRDTNAYLWMALAGGAKGLLGSDEEAVTALRRAIEINRNYSQAHLWLAATCLSRSAK